MIFFKIKYFFCCLILVSLSCSQISDIEKPNTPLLSPDTDQILESTIDSLLIININVSQGDSTLILTPHRKVILIDGGNVDQGYDTIIPFLEKLHIYKIDYIFVSHFDLDHYGGLLEVIKGRDKILGTADDYIPETIFDRGLENFPNDDFSQEYFEMTQSIRKEITPLEELVLEDNLMIKCLAANGSTKSQSIKKTQNLDENSRSLSLLIKFHEFEYLTSGDLTGGGKSGSKKTANIEELLLEYIEEIDVLKVNHHGSKTSSHQSFLDHVSPTASIISVGNNNNYGHPHTEVISKLIALPTDIFQTEQGDNFHFPETHIFNDSIYIEISPKEKFTINGYEYKIKSKLK